MTKITTLSSSLDSATGTSSHLAHGGHGDNSARGFEI